MVLDHPNGFRGYGFQTKEIQQAMRIGHTTANTDDKLFRYSRLSDDHTGKATEYVEDNKHSKLFDEMSIAQWNNYLDDAKKEKEAEDRRQAREEERKRKRQQGKDEKKKKRKGEDQSGPSRHRETSQTLDDDDDDQ